MFSTKEKRKGFGDFRLDDRASCEKAIKHGVIAAMISAGITALFAMTGFFTSSTDKDLAYILDPWLMVDVVLIIVLAVFILRKSRVASTLLFIYFIMSKAMMWYEMAAPKGLFISIVFFVFYLNAMRATYIWHKRYKNIETTTSVLS